MAIMAKKKTSRAQPETKGRARERGDTVTFTFEMDPPLDAAFEAAAIQERRTKKAVLTMALEKYLKELGLWPPVKPSA
jgi:phage terminase large subunit-like protein